MSHLSSLVAQVHPLWCGKVHSFRHTVATAHPGHERTGEDHHELPALLDRTVDLYPLATKHLRRNLEKYTLLSSLYKSITFHKQCQQTHKKVMLCLFTISYHNILLQHFQSRRAVGLQQCVHHFIKLCLFLSRNRIPVMAQAKLPVSVIVWMT